MRDPAAVVGKEVSDRLAHSIALASTMSMDSLDRRKKETVEAPMITHIAPEAAEYVHPARIKRLENMSSAAFTTVDTDLLFFFVHLSSFSFSSPSSFYSSSSMC